MWPWLSPHLSIRDGAIYLAPEVADGCVLRVCRELSSRPPSISVCLLATALPPPPSWLGQGPCARHFRSPLLWNTQGPGIACDPTDHVPPGCVWSTLHRPEHARLPGPGSPPASQAEQGQGGRARPSNSPRPAVSGWVPQVDKDPVQVVAARPGAAGTMRRPRGTGQHGAELGPGWTGCQGAGALTSSSQQKGDLPEAHLAGESGQEASTVSGNVLLLGALGFCRKKLGLYPQLSKSLAPRHPVDACRLNWPFSRPYFSLLPFTCLPGFTALKLARAFCVIWKRGRI